MNNLINNDSPLGEDFYNFQKEDKEIHTKVISKLKVSNKKEQKINDDEINSKTSYKEENNCSVKDK